MIRRTAAQSVTAWAEAFRDGGVFASAKYNIATDGSEALFHGNRVAWRNAAGMTFVHHAGYGLSPTTRDRCNALFEALGAPYMYQQWDFVCHLVLSTTQPFGHRATQEDREMVDAIGEGPVPVCGPLALLAQFAVMRASQRAA